MDETRQNIFLKWKTSKLDKGIFKMSNNKKDNENVKS